MMNTIRSTVIAIVVGLIVLGLPTLSGAASLNAGSMGSEDGFFIDVEKNVSIDGGAWQDADVAPGPEVPEGSYVEFRYVITNLTPDYYLIALRLTDTMTELAGCPVPFLLLPSQSFECVVGPIECVPGQHTSTATVTGLGFGDPYTDTDDVNYIGLGDSGEQPGTGTAGYWKNHPEAWPVEEIIVGGMIHSRDDAIELMRTPGKGDKTYNMFRTLVAAMLNVMIGNDSSCIEDVIVAADDWMALYPVGSGVRANSDAWQENQWLHQALDQYNNGLLCAPPRD